MSYKTKKQPFVSIIIPVYVKTPYFYEAVDKCLELDYTNYEIIIGVDKGVEFPLKHKKIRIIYTNKENTGPAEKRDMALRGAKGEIIAFLDDDSYPERDWLKKAVKIMQKKKVNSVGGPGLTPSSNGFFEKMTGAILGSVWGSGPFYYRFARGRPRFVDDYPAYNLFVTKKALKKVGGYGTKFYGGEDTALCLKLINSGYKIYYHPSIIVYHHRRPFPQGYFKQIANVGLHRGYFVKAYPQTSLRIVYFLPTIFSIVGIFLVFLSFFNFTVFLVTVFILFSFSVLIFFENLPKTQLHINIFLPGAVIISHFVYGYYFLKGALFTKELKR